MARDTRVRAGALALTSPVGLGLLAGRGMDEALLSIAASLDS
ncbi:MAG TPA: hypothetical protein VK461_16255 [Acidimicrobiales bacterium]|nr:hypothetical protein [Acidimicrobiales bacterium]